jgi:hypothetical protein
MRDAALDRAGEGRWSELVAWARDDAASDVATDEEIVIKAQFGSSQRPAFAVYVVVREGKEWSVGAWCRGSAQVAKPKAAPDKARKRTQ